MSEPHRTDVAAKPSFLDRVALGRPELRAWALYDWANSAFYTVVITAVFPIFYARVVAVDLSADERRSTFGWATTLSLLCAAVIAPVFGALADVRRWKKALFGAFLALGVGATAGLSFLQPGDHSAALWLFGAANIGAAGSFVFYDALLPHVARQDEMDRLSTSAYALGYLAGGLCLALSVALIRNPEWIGLVSSGPDDGRPAAVASRVSFMLVAVWWLLFSLPLFLRVREPELPPGVEERSLGSPLRGALSQLGETFRQLATFKNAFLMMVAFLIYNDGVGTIIRMAALYGEERHVDPALMLVCILLVQFVGIPFTMLFGVLARKVGSKHAIEIALCVYVLISWIAYRMDTAAEFVVMALLVGTVQGGVQALSRSLFASLIPKHKSGEFFGLFSTLEKFAGVLGPALFSVSPSSTTAVLSMVLFFVVGGAVLMRVNVAEGRRLAQSMEPEAAAG